MLRLLYFLLSNLLLLALYPLFAWRRSRACPEGAWLRVPIEGSIVELAPRLPFWRRRKRLFALENLRRVVELAADDPKVKGLLIELERMHAGSATATGLREILLWAKIRGKRVVVYLPSGAGTRELYVASAADRVLIGPETDVAALGFAIEAPYLKVALDRAGIRPEVFARGAYKSAGESLILQQMSAPQREQLELLLETAWQGLIEALASGRNLPREAVERFIHEGPWQAKAAVDQGFADGIVYKDGLEKQLEPRTKNGARVVPAGRYQRRRRIPWRRLPRPRIGVVQVHGPIVSEARGPMPVAAEDSVCEALDRAREDRGVRGALLHIDSRGGSALASDRMLHAVKRLAETKPVVACLSDYAASGGYMIAVGAHKIVAQPMTVTGSIGVVAARIVIGPLLERLGISVEVVKRGARADMHSPARELDAGERAVIERQLDHVYRSFVDAVALGRKRELAEIDALAGGRIWSGRDAHARGLVDRLGGFDVALGELRTLVGAGAEGLEPVLVGPRRLRPAALGLPRWFSAAAAPRTAFSWLGTLADAAPLLPQSVADVIALCSSRRDRSWLWAAIEVIDLGRG